MSVELVPCPFCGREANSTYNPDSRDWPEQHGCAECWVFTATPEAWNMRVNPAPQARRDPPQERRGPTEREQAGRPPTNSEAGSVVLRFGQYKGKTLGDIGSTSKGKDYLGWLLGTEYLKPETRQEIETYLGDDDPDQRRADEDPAY